MFDDLQRLFKDSLAAFRAEVGRREPEDQVAELLTAMRREMVAARAALPELAAQLERARRELASERALLEQCERRGKLAERIGDGETVRVAGEFAARHRERIGVLEQKVTAAEAEQALRQREAEEMKRRYQAADANRFQLVAELRRGASRERLRQTADRTGAALDDFDRMAERIDGGAAYADALGEMDPAPPPRGGSPDDVEARLRELKRQMGRE